MRFRSVSRRFGSVVGVADLHLDVPYGAVTVLLGANGAGKTTTLRLATGVLRPDSGTISVFGLDPFDRGQEIRRRCGVVPPKPAMYDRLTGRQNLAYAARLFELDSPPIDEIAEVFGIGHALGKKVGGYSTGMRTRLAISRAMLHDPDLLLLDEPTAGLDPEAARSLRQVILETTSLGKTVVMSTHLLAETEGAVDQVVLIDGGKAWEAGAPSVLARRYWNGSRVAIQAEDMPEAVKTLASFGLDSVAGDDGAVVITLSDLSELPDLIERLVKSAVRLTRVEPLAPTLERLYAEMRARVAR